MRRAGIFEREPWIIWSSIIIPLLVAFLTAIFLPALRIAAHRRHCLSQLASLGTVIALYASDYNGTFPPKISVLTSNGYLRPSVLKCPMPDINAVLPPGSNADQWMDYIYIYWPEGKDTPKDYPVIYDRKLSNHGGKGINILRREGIAPGPKMYNPKPIWDKNAEWLKKFAKEHPEYNIPLPEDVK